VAEGGDGGEEITAAPEPTPGTEATPVADAAAAADGASSDGATIEDEATWRVMFDRIDKDGDGSVERDEVAAMLASNDTTPEFVTNFYKTLALPQEGTRVDGSHEGFDAIWNQIDVDGDLAVDFDEFCRYLRTVN